MIVGILLLGACPSSISDADYELSLSPQSASLFAGDSARFTATLEDGNGSPVDTPLTWSTDKPSVATVDASGWVRGVGPGTAMLRVSARGKEATAAITVAEDDGRTLKLDPSAASILVNGTQRFKAVLTNRDGDTLAAEPEWQSNNTAVASVSGTGLVRGVAPGTATIRATVDGLVASAQVTVSAQPSSVVFVGSGDIASCTMSGDEETAKLLDDIPGTVFTTGDNAYPNGSAEDYKNCYEPTWGRHKSRTRPVPGNHEYYTPNATPYYDYFGEAAGDPTKGYYSYELGGWHIIALNSNLRTDAGSPQEQWLRADLADNDARCTLAYFHHPRFNSGDHHDENRGMEPLWQALYDYNADVVLSGHEHVYERFAPQTPNGQFDLSRGIRQFTVGTGGGDLYPFSAPRPNSEVRYNDTRGILKLTLSADRYSWEFIPTEGSFTDSGSGSCH